MLTPRFLAPSSRSLNHFTTTFRIRALFGIKKTVLKRGEADLQPIAPGSGSGFGESKKASASEKSCGFQPDAQDDSGPGVAGDGELVKAARGISEEGRLVLQGLIAAFSQMRPALFIGVCSACSRLFYLCHDVPESCLAPSLPLLSYPYSCALSSALCLPRRAPS